ncbi:hypothetical protein [Leptospira licerasiae]|uniref:hypothetical protein n=1 Tax=Leptospira licerasiae TaxID=447106 RepID=UPI00301A46EE
MTSEFLYYLPEFFQNKYFQRKSFSFGISQKDIFLSWDKLAKFESLPIGLLKNDIREKVPRLYDKIKGEFEKRSENIILIKDIIHLLDQGDRRLFEEKLVPVRIELQNITIQDRLNLAILVNAYWLKEISFINCGILIGIVLAPYNEPTGISDIVGVKFDKTTFIEDLTLNNLQGGKFRYILSFEDTRINTLQIKSKIDIEGNNFRNLNANIVYVEGTSSTFQDCNVGLFVLQDKEKFREKLAFERIKIIFPFVFNAVSVFKKRLNKNITITDQLALSSLKTINTYPSIESSKGNLEKLYSFFDSRRSLMKKIIYLINSFHYAIVRPIFFGALAFYAIVYLINIYSSEFTNPIPVGSIFIPNEFLKNIVFDSFRFRLSFSSISWVKLCILILWLIMDYCIFSVFIGIKKRFGYRKPFS